MHTFTGGTVIAGTQAMRPRDPIEFTVAVLPDTQNLARFSNTDYADLIQYVVDNVETENIRMVLHVGDTVDTGTSSTEHSRANAALALLEGETEFLIGIGNNDYDDDSGVNRTANSFNGNFPLSIYTAQSGFLDADPGSETVNTASKLTIGSCTYLFLNIEYLPREASVTWANGIISSNTDADYIIIANHYFLGTDGNRYDDSSITNLWDNLILPNDKVRLVVSGHIPGTTTTPAVSRRTDGNVHQHVFNAQTMTADDYGASAFVRFYKINQDGHTVSVTTYNPVTDTALTDSDHQFTFNL